MNKFPKKRLDLSDLCVTDLRLQTGASVIDLTLPANAGHTRVKIGAGVALVTVRVPSGVAARIRVGDGLASVNVDGNRFPREGGVYQSLDYVHLSQRPVHCLEVGDDVAAPDAADRPVRPTVGQPVELFTKAWLRRGTAEHNLQVSRRPCSLEVLWGYSARPIE